MEENNAQSRDGHPDGYIPLIRRHAHDVRNGLNGFEMEVSLMEALHGDDRTRDCVRRMRNQGGLIELALRFLLNRFIEPDVDLVPAIDVFNLWRSRSKRLSHYDEITWTHDLGDALISVDANIVAEALCEGVSYAKGAAIDATASREGDEVLFEIRPGSESSEASLLAVSEWPLLDQLILKNGGRHEAVTESGRAIRRRYWFPVSPRRDGSGPSAFGD